MKAVETIAFLTVVYPCPWDRSSIAFLRGLEYSILFLSSTYDTIFLGAMMLLSKVSTIYILAYMFSNIRPRDTT